MVVPHGHPRIVARNNADLPHGCHRSSVQVDADFPCGRAQIFHAKLHGSSVRNWVENGRNQKANFVCNNTEESRNMSQGSLELSL